MNSKTMFDLPKRMTLSMQAAAAIRKAVEKGTWHEHLPSERRLCEFFQVSRPTIRSALRLLAREGLVEIHQGRRNRLLTLPTRRTEARARLVGLITQGPDSHISQTSHQLIGDLRTHLAKHGIATERIACPPADGRAQLRAVEMFVRQNRFVCCILITVNKAVQQWFAERSVPALVLGSCHEAVQLPSIDVDYRSVCRHAAGIFLGRGHRHLALVVHNSGFAGDLASEQGFSEGVERFRGSAARTTMVRHNGTAQNITAKLDALFQSAQAPTALLVARPWALFAVIIYLLRRGRTVPDSVSLISRDQDYVFETLDPLISHYRFEGHSFVQQLSRLVLKLVSDGYLAPEPTLLFPKFFAGGTVKRLNR
jgi:DNA-binding LacI/PurR family transcriptional regulator